MLGDRTGARLEERRDPPLVFYILRRRILIQSSLLWTLYFSRGLAPPCSESPNHHPPPPPQPFKSTTSKTNHPVSPIAKQPSCIAVFLPPSLLQQDRSHLLSRSGFHFSVGTTAATSFQLFRLVVVENPPISLSACLNSSRRLHTVCTLELVRSSGWSSVRHDVFCSFWICGCWLEEPGRCRG